MLWTLSISSSFVLHSFSLGLSLALLGGNHCAIKRFPWGSLLLLSCFAPWNPERRTDYNASNIGMSPVPINGKESFWGLCPINNGNLLLLKCYFCFKTTFLIGRYHF